MLPNLASLKCLNNSVQNTELWSGFQRPVQEPDPSAVECHGKIFMTAVKEVISVAEPSIGLPPNMRGEPKVKKTYVQAKSRDEATGVRLTMDISVFYTSKMAGHPTPKLDPEFERMVVKRSFMYATRIFANLFAIPLQSDLGWFSLAGAFMTAVGSKLDDEEYKLQVLPDMGQQAARDSFSAYAPLGMGVEIGAMEFGHLTAYLPDQVTQYSSALYKLAEQDQEHRFPTYCKKGNTIELVMDLAVGDVITIHTKDPYEKLIAKALDLMKV